MKNDSQKLDELNQLLLPVMQYLGDNFNPHMYIMVDSEQSELVAGHKIFRKSHISAPNAQDHRAGEQP
jgi:hypothetical protein